ncbi:MAG: hypothetical protein IH624_16305 [Phycisphaerae bacterium]|nr:hypothetical protein [Phycisphaerae bacterium]
MATAGRRAVLCLGMIAYTLTAIAAPVEAVLCFGPDGHVAVEQEHRGCCEHTGKVATGLRMRSEPTAALLHNCCIDISLPSANTRPCTLEFDKNIDGPAPDAKPLPQSSDSAAAVRFLPPAAGVTHPPDPPTATIVLLI